MRTPRTILLLASMAPLGSIAQACESAPISCLPAAVAYPVYTHEGLRVGSVESPVRMPLGLEVSRYTGQPITVVYNDPGRLPGSVEPRLELVPLPRGPRFHTRAVYPRGY